MTDVPKAQTAEALLPILLRHGAKPALRLAYDFAVLAAFAKKRGITVWEVLGLTVDEKAAGAALLRLPDNVGALIAAIDSALAEKKGVLEVKQDIPRADGISGTFSETVAELLIDATPPAEPAAAPPTVTTDSTALDTPAPADHGTNPDPTTPKSIPLITTR